MAVRDQMEWTPRSDYGVQSLHICEDFHARCVGFCVLLRSAGWPNVRARVCIGARSRVRGEEKGDAVRDRECSTFYVSDTVENSWWCNYLLRNFDRRSVMDPTALAFDKLLSSLLFRPWAEEPIPSPDGQISTFSAQQLGC